MCSVCKSVSALVLALQDGSYYVWNAATFKLVRSFTLPTAHILRSLHQTFALSPDGQLLVSGGPSPLLFVFNVVGGIFLFALHLPDSAVGTGAQQLHFLPDSSTLAGQCSPTLGCLYECVLHKRLRSGRAQHVQYAL